MVGFIAVTAPAFGDVCDTTAGNIVLNCGFEANSTVPPTDWTFTPAPSGSDFYIGPPAFSGVNAANFGAYGAFDDTISQTLPTAAGGIYDLQFYLQHESTNAQNDFSASFGGVPVFSLVDAPAFPYELINVPGLAATGPTTLSFSGLEVDAYYDLDSVSVTQTGSLATPEPSSVLLLMTCLAGLTGIPRLRRAFGR